MISAAARSGEPVSLALGGVNWQVVGPAGPSCRLSCRASTGRRAAFSTAWNVSEAAPRGVRGGAEVVAVLSARNRRLRLGRRTHTWTGLTTVVHTYTPADQRRTDDHQAQARQSSVDGREAAADHHPPAYFFVSFFSFACSAAGPLQRR